MVTRDSDREAEARGGLSLGGILVISGILLMALWSFRIGLAIALTGLAITLVGLFALDGVGIKKRH